MHEKSQEEIARRLSAYYEAEVSEAEPDQWWRRATANLGPQKQDRWWQRAFASRPAPAMAFASLLLMFMAGGMALLVASPWPSGAPDLIDDQAGWRIVPQAGAGDFSGLLDLSSPPLSFEVAAEQPAFVQGEPIGLLVRVRNNGSEAATLENFPGVLALVRFGVLAVDEESQINMDEQERTLAPGEQVTVRLEIPEGVSAGLTPGSYSLSVTTRLAGGAEAAARGNGALFTILPAE